MIIRHADTNDIEAIQTITQLVWPATYTHIIGNEQIEYMLNKFYATDALSKQMTEERHNFLIAQEEDSAVGFAAWSEIAYGVAKLHKLYVLTDVQGKGIGKQLIATIKEQCKLASISQLILNVNRYNKPAIEFYRKYGFEIIKTEDIDIGNGYFMNDYILALDL